MTASQATCRATVRVVATQKHIYGRLCPVCNRPVLIRVANDGSIQEEKNGCTHFVEHEEIGRTGEVRFVFRTA